MVIITNVQIQEWKHECELTCFLLYHNFHEGAMTAQLASFQFLVATQEILCEWGRGKMAEEQGPQVTCPHQLTQITFFLFIYLLFIYFIYDSHRERKRERGGQRHRQREKQAPRREPNVGLHPGTPGSRPGLKAGAERLSHPGIPSFVYS